MSTVVSDEEGVAQIALLSGRHLVIHAEKGTEIKQDSAGVGTAEP